MPDTCAVIGCDRRKKKHSLEDDGFTPLNFFSFKSVPNKTLKEWIRVCRRTDITPKNCKNMIICSRHFLPSEITGNRFLKPRIKLDAIPSRNIPNEVPRVKTSQIDKSAEHPLEKEYQDSFDNSAGEMSDDVPVARNIHPYMRINEVLPYWYCKPGEEFVLYYEVLVSKDSIPEVTKSVKIFSDGSLPQLNVRCTALAQNMVMKTLGNLDVNVESDFIALLEEFSKLSAKADMLTSAVRILQTIVNDSVSVARMEEPEVNAGDVQDDRLFLRFVMEQIELHTLNPEERLWNSDLIRWATVMRCHSLSAYRSLYKSGYLILPSERTLARYATPKVSNIRSAGSGEQDSVGQSVLRGLLEKENP